MPPQTNRQLFIYWHVAEHVVADELDAAIRAVKTWQLNCVQSAPQLLAQLFVRIDAAAAQATVMETYAVDSATGIDATLEQHLTIAGDAATQPWRLGPRKVEAFARCD